MLPKLHAAFVVDVVSACDVEFHIKADSKVPEVCGITALFSDTDIVSFD